MDCLPQQCKAEVFPSIETNEFVTNNKVGHLQSFKSSFSDPPKTIPPDSFGAMCQHLYLQLISSVPHIFCPWTTSFLFCTFSKWLPPVLESCHICQVVEVPHNEIPRVLVSWKGRPKLFLRINIDLVNIVIIIRIVETLCNRPSLSLSFINIITILYAFIISIRIVKCRWRLSICSIYNVVYVVFVDFFCIRLNLKWPQIGYYCIDYLAIAGQVSMPILKWIAFLQFTNEPDRLDLNPYVLLLKLSDEMTQVPTIFKLSSQNDTILLWVHRLKLVSLGGFKLVVRVIGIPFH